MTPTDTEQAFREFDATLQRDGIRRSLAGLLARTDYRFIGIFRFEGGKARAVVHYDRENPGVLAVSEVPETATYCCYVRDRRGSFVTADAMTDTRLASHPAREAVRAYCGVPVLSPEGRLLGTLCHYDLVPRDPAQVDLALMLQVASTLAQRDAIPAYAGD